MDERFIRCVHCGLSHERQIATCPTTGLRIEHHERFARRPRRGLHGDKPEHLVGWVLEGKYRVVGLIGEGGMSAIYEAEHLGFDRMVAIKVLHASLADDPDAIARLQHEALVVGAIGHPNICAIHDLGRAPDGGAYLVMERLVGESLADRIKLFGALSFGELAPLVLDVLAALGAAHDKGILHRDLKPENVFVVQTARQRATAKLLDFGISKSIGYDFGEQQRLTHSGMVMGTPYYMSPEQARGDGNLDQRVDLWAVAVLMYEALTGRKPFVATNYNALLVKILTSHPRPIQKIVPGVPAAVVHLVDRGLSKLREDRFQTAAEFAHAIRAVQRETVAQDEHAPTMVIRQPRRHAAASSARGRGLQRGRNWNLEIEDPETFIDDEPPRDPASVARMGAVGTRPEGSRPLGGQLATLDDEPLEPTIKERLDDLEQSRADATDAAPSSLYDKAPSSLGTEVMPAPDGGVASTYDDERTTFYDIHAAEAKLEARRKSERPLPASTPRATDPRDGKKRRRR